MKFNENYLSWKDGINQSELKAEWIEELTNEISAIYGIDDMKAFRVNWKMDDENGFVRNNNVLITTGDKELEYDSKFLKEVGNEHGIDAVIEILSHEVGHQVFNDTGLKAEIFDLFENPMYKEKLAEIFKDVPIPEPPRNHSSYINEACADYISGLTARLCKINPEHMLSWYSEIKPISKSGIHPGSPVRMEMFQRGYSRIDRGAEAKILKAFENFSIYDLNGTYKNFDTLKNILNEDVIKPLLNGEIKPV